MVATQTSCTKHVHPASSNTAASTTQTRLPDNTKREWIPITLSKRRKGEMLHPVLLLALFFSSPAEQSPATRYLSELSDAPGKQTHKYNTNRIESMWSQFTHIHQLNYLVSKYFPTQYSSVNALVLIKNIWQQTQTVFKFSESSINSFSDYKRLVSIPGPNSWTTLW